MLLTLMERIVKMTPEQKQEILNKIREVHKIGVDETDPFFAIITANEVAFEDHLAKMDIQNMEFYAKMESFLQETRNLAEVRISKAVNEALERLDDYKKEIEEIKATQEPQALNSKPGVYYALIPIIAAAAGFAAALLIL